MLSCFYLANISLLLQYVSPLSFLSSFTVLQLLNLSRVLPESSQKLWAESMFQRFTYQILTDTWLTWLSMRLEIFSQERKEYTVKKWSLLLIAACTCLPDISRRVLLKTNRCSKIKHPKSSLGGPSSFPFMSFFFYLLLSLENCRLNMGQSQSEFLQGFSFRIFVYICVPLLKIYIFFLLGYYKAVLYLQEYFSPISRMQYGSSR